MRVLTRRRPPPHSRGHPLRAREARRTSRSSARRTTAARCCRSSARRTPTSRCSTCGCRSMDGLDLPRPDPQAPPEGEGRDPLRLDDPEHIQDGLTRGASAYIVKSINPRDLPSALRQAVEGSVFNAIGLPEADADDAAKAAGLTEREIVDPEGARARPVERRDRQGALGRRADGEVPPDEHLPQARRGEPHRGGALRLRARPARQCVERYPSVAEH